MYIDIGIYIYIYIFIYTQVCILVIMINSIESLLTMHFTYYIFHLDCILIVF